MTLSELQTSFEQAYGKQAEKIFFAPGRVNLIGEHTDYNGGSVLPCALSFGAWLLLREERRWRTAFPFSEHERDV